MILANQLKKIKQNQYNDYYRVWVGSESIMRYLTDNQRLIVSFECK